MKTFGLLWLFILSTPHGQIIGKVAETPRFEGEKGCYAFGDLTKPRVEDYVRGLYRADWSDGVQIHYVCSPLGSPA